MKIELWDLTIAGIIFPDITGIVWTNQCGGTSCNHPEMEGFLVPLHIGDSNILERNGLWRDRWAMNYEEYLKYIHEVEEFLGFVERVSESEFMDLVGDSRFNFMGLDEDNFDCGEAWIPVKIKQQENVPVQFENLRGRYGVLTYENSD